MYYDYDLLFLDKSQHVWCFIDALRSEEQQQKYYDEFSFSLNLEKNVAKIQTKQKLFIKKNMGSTSHYLNN